MILSKKLRYCHCFLLFIVRFNSKPRSPIAKANIPQSPAWDRFNFFNRSSEEPVFITNEYRVISTECIAITKLITDNYVVIATECVVITQVPIALPMVILLVPKYHYQGWCFPYRSTSCHCQRFFVATTQVQVATSNGCVATKKWYVATSEG